MGDNPDKAVSAPQLRQCPDGLTQRFFIESAEALVDKHRIQTDPARGGLDLVCKSQRQRQRSLERFAARERPHIPFRSVVVINDIQIESALAGVAARLLTPDKLVLPVGHLQQPQICTGDDPIEKGHLNVSLQLHLRLAA